MLCIFFLWLTLLYNPIDMFVTVSCQWHCHIVLQIIKISDKTVQKVTIMPKQIKFVHNIKGRHTLKRISIDRDEVFILFANIKDRIKCIQ